MFKYDLPFHNTPKYLKWLNSVSDKVNSVYFNIPSFNLPDARINSDRITASSIVQGLTLLPPNVKKYLTINGRFTPFAKYDKKNLQSIVSLLNKLHDIGCLDGVIYLDYYLLRMIGEIDRDFAKEIEAVPSINCYIDSFEKVNSQMVYIHDAGFKLPNKIILDRSLNRRMDDLRTTVERIRKKYPTIKIEGLANEGCIYQCPYKVNHDIAISMLNDKSVDGQKYLHSQMEGNSFQIDGLNEKHGCISHLRKHPARLFEIPFIRPEDLSEYENLLDIVKISGKVLPDEFVIRAFDAYEERSYDGNLLDILDATGNFRDSHFILNSEIPDSFHRMLTTCDKDCLSCKFCDRVAEKVLFEEKSDEPREQIINFCP